LARVGRSLPTPKIRINYENIILFILNVFNMQRKLWAIFLSPKMPIFSNLAGGTRKNAT
jgi:hypothetical protein